MVKNNYFEDLEKLGTLMLSAVSSACGEKSCENIADIRKSSDALICKTENILFSDFLPPLERDGIAAVAHSLSRVIDTAAELICISPPAIAFVKANEESKICIQLAKELCRNITLLRTIKRPKDLPNVNLFRSILASGRSAHKRSVLQIQANSYQRSQAEAVILLGRLRAELSSSFDDLIEIMLGNI